MIKSFKVMLITICCSVALNFTYAESLSLNIGVVDMPRLVEEYSEIKGVQQTLQAEFSQKDETLKSLGLEMKNAQDVLMSREWTDVEQKEHERQVLNLEREYARLASEFRQDYNLRRNEELYKMHKEITDAILDYAEVNQYDLILESGMIYAADRLQLTDAILNALRQKLEK